jgi:hypothetical protein
MTFLLVIVLSIIGLYIFLKNKSSLFLWYRRFRMWIWHSWTMWKIEGAMLKNSTKNREDF